MSVEVVGFLTIPWMPTIFSYTQFVTLVRTGTERLGPSFRGDQPGAQTHTFTYPIAAVKDVAGTAGYCIEAFARGVSPSGQAQTFSIVPDDQLDELDKKLLGIMMAGYPIVKYGWSADDEYMATQIAIQHFIFQHPEKYPNRKNVKFNNDDWSKWSNQPIIALAKDIYDQCLGNPYDPGSGNNAATITATPENNGEFINDGENIEITIAINANGSFQRAKLTLPDEIRNIVKSGKGFVTVNGRMENFKSYILGSTDSFEGIELR